MKKIFDIRIPSWVYSIRVKLGAVTGGLLLGTALFVFIYVPARLREQAELSLHSRIQSIASMTAFAVSPALVARDARTVDEALQVFIQNADIEYIVVQDDSGGVLSSYNATRAELVRCGLPKLGVHLSSDGNTYMWATGITANSRHAGTLYMGVSLYEMNRALAQSRATIGLVSLGIFIVGMLWVIGLHHLVTRRLKRMVHTMSGISSGTWIHCDTVGSNDEVGQLAASVNAMVDSLQRAHNALSSSEKTYRQLFESNPHPMWVYDVATMRFIAANDTALRFYNYTRDEFLEMTIPDLHPKSQHSLVLENVRTHHDEHQTSTGWQHVKRDGTIVDVEIASHALPDRDGRQVRLVLAHDVTERRKAEVALRKSEMQFRLVWEKSADGMRLTDGNGIVLLANHAFCSMVGKSRQEIEGTPFSAMYGKEKEDEALCRYRERFSGRSVEPHFERELALWNGAKCWFDVSNSFFELEGQEPLLLSIFRDITGRKQAESEMRMLGHALKGINEYVTITDLKGRFTFVNDAFLKGYGYTREEVAGKDMLMLRSPRVSAPVADELNPEALTPSWRGEILHRRKDGTEFPVELIASLLRDETDTPVAYLGIASDISQRRTAEDALRLSEESHRNLYENSPLGIYRTTPDGHILMANPALVHMLGYNSFEELEAQDVEEHYYEEVDSRQAFKNDLARGSGVRGRESAWRKRDGSVVFVREYARSIVDANGNLLYYEGVVEDITERKRGERALEESEKRFKALFDEAPVGYHELDAAGRITRVNRTELDMLGYTAEEMLGQYVWDFAGEREFWRKAVLAKLSGTTAPVDGDERTLRRKDSTTLPVIVEDRVLRDAEGNIAGIRTIIQDNTERRRAELALLLEKTRFEQLFQNAPVAIHLADTEDRILLTNRFHQKMFGYPPEEIVGKRVQDTIAPDELRNESLDLLSSGMGGEAVQKETVRKHKDGSLIPVIVYSVPIIVDDGPIGIYGMYADIGERKRAEMAQQSLVKELEEANKELNDFAYIISHDLKAPLRAIGSLTSWLATDYRDQFGAEGAQLIDLLVGRTKRMHDLIDGVLEYSRLGRQEEMPGEVSLDQLVPDIVQMLDPPKRITVTIQHPLPEVHGEPVKIRQVFQNLIGNAVKYMDKQNGLIKVGAERSNGHWKFAVSDNGPGIEQQHFEKIFQIFQTLNARDDIESTGIGLTIVKKIVDAMGGSIWVESTPGNGSTFYFTLPANDVSYHTAHS